MKSQTSLVAQQTRLSEWAEQIKECQNRPQGMKIDEWCRLHGITKANYYWRLRRVREAFLETTEIAPTFVKLPAPIAWNNLFRESYVSMKFLKILLRNK